MSEFFPIQTNFAGGEISPLMYGNVDQAMYHQSLSQIVNFIPLTQGAIQTRGPFTRVAEIPCALPMHLIPIEITDDVGIVGILACGIFKLYDKNGPLDGSLTTEVLLNPRFETGLESWGGFTTNVLSPSSVVYATNEWTWDSATQSARLDSGHMADFSSKITQTMQAMVLEAGKEYTFEVDTRYEQINDGEIPPGLPLSQMFYKILQPPAGQEYNYLPANPADIQTWPILQEGELNANENTFKYTPAVNETVWMYIHYSYTQPAASVEKSSYLDKVRGFYVDAGSIPAEWPDPWLGLDYDQIQVKKVPGKSEIIFVHPLVPPYRLVYDRLTNSWVFELVPFVAQPPHWAANNYPSAVGFHSGRCYFGGSILDPDRMDASVAGSVYDFTVPGAPDASTAFFFFLPEAGRVRWIRSMRELLIGTSQAAFSVTTQSVLSVIDYQVNTQHGYGSTSGDTQIVSNSVMHITDSSETIHATEYKESGNGYVPEEVTEFAEHLFRGVLRRLSYQRQPNETLWALKKGGAFLYGMSYKKRQGVLQVQGWHPHATQGRFEDIASVDNATGDTLFALVKRQVMTGGDFENPVFSDVINLEVYTPGAAIALDALTLRTYPDAVDTLDLLEHFEGLEVDVVREDTDFSTGKIRYAWLGKHQVQNGGIVLNEGDEGDRFFVGLSYDPTFTTLPVTAGDSPGGGTIQNAFKGWSEITVRTVDSAAPIVNGETPPDRTPGTPMDLSEPTRTTDFKVMNLGYDTFGLVTVKQDVPFRTTVSALFGKTDISNI